MALTKVDGQLIGAPAAVSGALYTGSLATTPLGGATNPTIGAIETANNYIQAYAYNTANGTFSSADMVVYPNNGQDASGWVDVGITSNNYSQAAYSITGRNEGYLFMSAPTGSGTSGNLVIGTDSTGQYNSVQMYTGGFAQGKTTPKWQLDGATGNMQVAGYASMQNTFGFKNRIINGDMRVAQRTTNSQTLSAGVDCYPVDRWNVYGTQSGKISTIQVVGSAASGFQTHTSITSLSAYTTLATDTMGIGQAIEASNISDFNFGTSNAKSVTLSFWVKSSLTGTHSGVMINYAATRSYPFPYTINSANTWEYKTITIPGDTAGTWVLSGNVGGCKILFDMGTGSTYRGPANAWAGTYYNGVTGSVSINGTNGATWAITGIQLEVGSQATPFDFRDYGTELLLCQRYFEIVRAGGMGTWSSGNFTGVGAYSVNKRGTPTVTRLSAYSAYPADSFNAGNIDLQGFAINLSYNSTYLMCDYKWSVAAEL